MKRSDMFLGGLETNVRRIALPRDFSLFPTTADENQIHFFEKDTTITFYANGTFGTRPCSKGAICIKGYGGIFFKKVNLVLIGSSWK